MTITARQRTLLLLAAAVAVCLVVATQLLTGWGQVDTAPLLREAQAALTQSDYQRAGTLLDQILVQEPQHQAALIERGKLWATIGRIDDALQDWQSAASVEGKKRSPSLASEARFLQGDLLVRLHRVREAEQHLLEAWELDSQSPQPLEILLRLYVLQMRGPETRRILNLMELRRKLSLEEMVLRVDAGGPIIDAAQAIDQLKTFVQTDKEDVHSAIALLRYYFSSERLNEAEQLPSALAQSALANSDVIGLRALCALKRLANDEARALLQQQPTNQPAGYWWWVAAGELAEADGQACLAAESFQRAVTADPDSGVARYRCGLALEACGKPAEAREQLATAADIDRLHQHSAVITRMVGMAPAELAKTMLEIATLQRNLKKSDEAARWAKLVLEIQPANPNAVAIASSQASTVKPAGATAQATGASIPVAIAAWLAGKAVSTSGNDSTAPSETTSASPVRFAEVHEAAQLDFQYFNGNSGSKYLIEAMGGAIGVLDYDADGWPDCYFPQGSQIPSDPKDFSHLDQLYRNMNGQRFGNVTAQARIVENGYSQGIAAADVNNDGFCDVVVANYGRSRLFLNQGDGTFIDATDAWGLNAVEMSSSAALADLDNDGDLDLYLVNYVDGIRVCRDAQGRISTCNPQNFSGVQDRVYQNTGEGSFADITSESGAVDADGKGLGVVICDLDDDGLSDIYVANDTTPNLLFQNLGGMRFRDVSLPSGTALSLEGQAQAGMGIAAADLNGDLLTDLFVTNFYDEPNNVYINQGQMLFADEAARARIVAPSKPMLGFGTQAEDFDLDGTWDLIVANGHIDDFSYRGEPWKMPTQLFCNLGGGIFAECDSNAGEYFREQVLGRGVASIDWNRDGRKDFIVVHQDRPVALLENRTESGHHSLTVELTGTVANRDAIGAKVTVTVGGQKIRRDIAAGDGFYSTNQRRLTFGLGTADSADSVAVEWPSGGKQVASEGNFSGEVRLLQQK